MAALLLRHKAEDRIARHIGMERARDMGTVRRVTRKCYHGNSTRIFPISLERGGDRRLYNFGLA